MWIRSQDKKNLMKATQVMVLEGVNSTSEILINDYEGNITLGFYETEERALKVLDYIQNAISKGEKVYTMPEN